MSSLFIYKISTSVYNELSHSQEKNVQATLLFTANQKRKNICCIESQLSELEETLDIT